uniref:Photosystem I assembly protein Ycf4 n=1 Tax=Codium fragile TaxID=3133 RepID=A0A6B9PI23_CODFR|nr:photosystem I assembly protein Ycf4 [Codium fragile]
MNSNIRRYKVEGTRKLSNYFWAIFIGIGSSFFFLIGLVSSNSNSIISNNISFFPQGIIMSFYGLIGILFSLYLWLTILWSIGSGFNEFNRKKKMIRIFRWGFPGKNRRINLYYKFEEIKAIKLEKKIGLNTIQSLYLQIINKKEIPLFKLGYSATYELLEKQAADLAKFLNVSLII